MMLKILTSVNEYMDFVNEINSIPNFSEPMLSSEEQIRCNLLDIPNKHLLHNLLQNEQSEFEAEQQKMLLKKSVSYESNHQIELYSSKYKEQYISIHSKGGYWTADKVIDASDRFRIILAIENNEVVGYTDVTYQYDVNEPYDIFVKEEYRNKGYGKAMVAKALELNKPKDMMLLVDVDNIAAVALFESLGFVHAVGENSVTAHVLL